MSDAPLIELITDDDSLIVYGPPGSVTEGVHLAPNPDGLYSTSFRTRTTSGAFEVGGRFAGHTIPIREMVLGFNILDNGDGIDAAVSRFRKLWRVGRQIQWKYTTALSGPRTLWVQLSEEINLTTEYDRNVSEFVHATVSAIALQPMYEGVEESVSWSNPSSGSHTGSLIIDNPTDQDLWLEWTIDPATMWAFPDFSFGNEERYERPADADAERMIVTPVLTQKLSVMADKQFDTYVFEDLSNGAGLFNGVKPQYWVPPYTPPTEVPVAVNGPADATITCTMRRLWSAESGLE